ncbi:hypothetical protein [Lysobacter sp. Root494]|uniref:hypothetical protein n=1 Tax=Lysobacter sp. Root494 TaxID=1736549 RepID=UPI0006FDD4A0|nr:hypothetical protein [Lysobacter sp. Root494]KQY51937.1 hypothetical protein ASD14_04490 [Lysobacter sp. Root494]
MMLSDKTIKNIAVWFLVLIGGGLLTGWAYAVKTSWQNEERLAEVSSDLKSIKRSLIRISIKTNPNDPTVATDLLSGTAVEQGIGHFKAGEFPAAYAAWSSAAKSGDGDAAFAIFTATAALQEKARDPSVPAAERKTAAAAILTAPQVVERNGKFVLKGGN